MGSQFKKTFDAFFSSENFLLVAIFVGFPEGDFGTIRKFVNSSQETYMQVL